MMRDYRGDQASAPERFERQMELLSAHPVDFSVHLELAHTVGAWSARAARDLQSERAASPDHEYLQGYVTALNDVQAMLGEGFCLVPATTQDTSPHVHHALPEWLQCSTQDR